MQALMILILLLLAAGTRAATPADCAGIEDAARRLACFDSAFKTAPAAGSATGETAVKQPSAPVVAPQPVNSTGASGTPIDAPTAAPGSAEPAAGKPVRTEHGMFDQRDKRVVTATVIELMNRNKQRMVFRLDNDEIWIQSSPRNLPIRVGDSVTIKSGLMGGYILRSESGVSTRVKRISTP